MKKELMLFTLFFIFSSVAFAEDLIEDKNNPRYGLPAYSKEDLQEALTKIPSPAGAAIEKALPPRTLERLDWSEEDLQGSKVVLAQAIKVREGEDSDGAVGDNFVYFLIEITKGKARLWKLYKNNYPVESFMVPFFGFVHDPALQACHLDFYVNQDTDNETVKKDFFHFISGKKPRVVLSVLDCKYNPNENPNPSPTKQFIYETRSVVFPEKGNKVRVETLNLQGFHTINPDLSKAVAEPVQKKIRINAEYRWVESKERYEPIGAPITQRLQ